MAPGAAEEMLRAPKHEFPAQMRGADDIHWRCAAFMVSKKVSKVHAVGMRMGSREESGWQESDALGVHALSANPVPTQQAGKRAPKFPAWPCSRRDAVTLAT
jgi:hypothetical protein